MSSQAADDVVFELEKDGTRQCFPAGFTASVKGQLFGLFVTVPSGIDQYKEVPGTRTIATADQMLGCMTTRSSSWGTHHHGW